MHTTSRFIAALPRAILLVGCMLLVSAWRWGPPLTYFEEEGAIARAVETLRAKGGFKRVLAIDIVETSISIEAQDPNRMQHVNRWTLTKQSISQLQWEETEGPDPVQLNLVNSDLESNLFDIEEVDFAAAEGLMTNALAQAALEDPASVDRMTIRRQLYLLPNPSSGDVRWNVDIRSDRENARVVADAEGRVAGLDLTGTNRARTFDLLKSLDRLPEAARAFEQAVGGEPVLAEVRITSRGATFETNITEKSPLFASLKQRQVFNWSLNGLERSMSSIDTSHYFGEEPPFSIKDTDWGMAGALVQKARDGLGMADAKLDDIELAKPKDQPTPRLEWEITLKQNGEEGVARFNAKGEPLGMTLPESRRKPFDGRDPAAWPAALQQITATFGGEGAIAELVIHDAHISIVATDPQNTKELGEFLLDEDGIKRFGTVSPFAESNPRFSVTDLTALDAAQMRKLQEATAQRLKLTPFTITSITIGKASLDPSPRGNVTVEIRAEEGPFKRGGRVNWEIDGREIKAYLP